MLLYSTTLVPILKDPLTKGHLSNRRRKNYLADGVFLLDGDNCILLKVMATFSGKVDF